MQEIALCTSSYSSNNCGTPLPALIFQCLEWETCMAKDPSVVGRAKVGAEMLAEVINSFVEPISWKTLVSRPPQACLTAHDHISLNSAVYTFIYCILHGFHQCYHYSLSLKTSTSPARCDSFKSCIWSGSFTYMVATIRVRRNTSSTSKAIGRELSQSSIATIKTDYVMHTNT